MILLTLLTLLKAIGLAFVITKFDPIKWIMDYLLFKTKNNLIILMIDKMLSCISCLSFWIALIVSGNIWIASYIYILTFAYDKFLSGWERKIKLD